MPLLVNDIYLSICDAGIKAGIPMLVLRLQGCSVGCPFCNVRETWPVPAELPDETVSDLGWMGKNPRYAMLGIERIVDLLKQAEVFGDVRSPVQWVQITGGEPAEQDLSKLTVALTRYGYFTMLETSGTAAEGCMRSRFDWVCVSPKMEMPGEKEIEPCVIMLADELRFPLTHFSDLSRIDAFLSKYPRKAGCEIVLQPIGAGDPSKIFGVQVALQRGWRLTQSAQELDGRSGLYAVIDTL